LECKQLQCSSSSSSSVARGCLPVAPATGQRQLLVTAQLSRPAWRCEKRRRLMLLLLLLLLSTVHVSHCQLQQLLQDGCAWVRGAWGLVAGCLLRVLARAAELLLLLLQELLQLLGAVVQRILRVC
jgi:hypothetical protein